MFNPVSICPESNAPQVKSRIYLIPMKDKIYRVIIHADLNPNTSVDLLVFRLRRRPDIDLVHHVQSSGALLILAATSTIWDCDELILRIGQLKGIAAVQPHFLFSRVTLLGAWPEDGGTGSPGGAMPGFFKATC